MPALNQRNLLWFKEIDKEDVSLVGGKGANLGEMTQAGFPVPNGFVVTSHAYYQVIHQNQLQPKIKAYLDNLDVEDPRALNQASKSIKDLIEKVTIPEDIETEVRAAYRQLGKGKDIFVAVRSSATAEDLPNASFAGQQETYLNVKGEDSLIHHLRLTWASLFEPRAIYYRHKQGFDHFKVALAIPVQKMVESDISGIMFSINPVNNDKTTIVIEAIWGLGEKIVQGAITPDHYEVDKNTFQILKKVVVPQDIEMVKRGFKNLDLKVPKSRRDRRKLSDEQIVELAKISFKLQQHYFFPQDTEWAIENGVIYIVQTRPITTIEAVKDAKEMDIPQKDLGQVLVSGETASPGRVVGVVRILKSAKEIDQVKPGDILVTSMTTPDFVPAMKKAVAIVTDKGGQTSHAAIVSRELGVPCIVGTKNATKVLKTGQLVVVDGKQAKVYQTKLKPSSVNYKPAPKPKKHPQDLKTATKVYVNLGEPSLAFEVAQKNVDGVGLLRAEFMIAEIGTHPKKLIHDHREKFFIDKLTEGLLTFCKAFYPRPVVYRATDFKTNEYRNLKGGEAYEPQEPNPMLGYRGAYRYINDPEVFALELEAIKQVRNHYGYKNLNLMIPFVRSVQELKQVKKIVVAHGLSRSASFKLWMMVEIPVNVIMLDDFIKVGIDGISVGTNDLTMLMLGADRDNEHVRTDYDERNPAILWALERIIKTANRHGITSSVCGQAPSRYPEITALLVKNGVTSVSVTPDMIDKTRQVIHETEKKLINQRR